MIMANVLLNVALIPTAWALATARLRSALRFVPVKVNVHKIESPRNREIQIAKNSSVDSSKGCGWCPNTICQCAEKEEFDQWQMCMEENSVNVGQCLSGCGADDNSCQSDCVESYYQAQTRCPCEVTNLQFIDFRALKPQAIRLTPYKLIIFYFWPF